LLLTLGDDGQGVDIPRLRDRLAEMGRGPFARSAPDQEILNTIFEAGVSSRSEASESSGRGLGLESVAAKVQDLGGYIQVTSRFGRGTEFRITLPLMTFNPGAPEIFQFAS